MPPCCQQWSRTFPPLVVLSEIRSQHVLFLDLLFTEDRCRSLNSNHPNAHSRGNRPAGVRSTEATAGESTRCERRKNVDVVGSF